VKDRGEQDSVHSMCHNLSAETEEAFVGTSVGASRPSHFMPTFPKYESSSNLSAAYCPYVQDCTASCSLIRRGAWHGWSGARRWQSARVAVAAAMSRPVLIPG
jgi:hypothetical protein